MRVFRAVSEAELRDCIVNGFEECFKRDRKGRRVRFKWFTVDRGYIISILERGQFHNMRPADAYEFVIELDVCGSWVKKVELGYINVGLDTSRPFFVGDCVSVMSAEVFRKVYGSFGRPLLYYWGRRGLKKVWGMNEVRNIKRNSRLDERAWFVRADKYNLVR